MDAKLAAKYLNQWAANDVMLRFFRALMTRDGSNFDTAYFLEKPWKWADEYVVWIAAGKPAQAGDEGWERFAAA